MDNTILDVSEITREKDYRDYLAPKWKRFINYLIDLFVIQYIFKIAYIYSIGVYPTGWEDVLANIYALLFSLFIYIVSELNTGKTLGKLITGTRVISIDDEPLTFRQILIRTLSRIVPFEPLSMFFGYTTWHDDWSDTAVVTNNYKES